MLRDTTPRHTSVTTSGLWRMAARTWHEPPSDTCSVVSASPSHSFSIKIIIPDFPLFFMRFPVGHSNTTRYISVYIAGTLQTRSDLNKL